MCGGGGVGARVITAAGTPGEVGQRLIAVGVGVETATGRRMDIGTALKLGEGATTLDHRRDGEAVVQCKYVTALSLDFFLKDALELDQCLTLCFWLKYVN